MPYLEYLVRHPRPRIGSARSDDPRPVVAPRTPIHSPLVRPVVRLPSATLFVGTVVLGAIAVVLSVLLLAATAEVLLALLGTTLVAIAAATQPRARPRSPVRGGTYAPWGVHGGTRCRTRHERHADRRACIYV